MVYIEGFLKGNPHIVKYEKEIPTGIITFNNKQYQAIALINGELIRVKIAPFPYGDCIFDETTDSKVLKKCYKNKGILIDYVKRILEGLKHD